MNIFFSRIKRYYNFFISLGADAHTPKGELKKIKLFNGFCALWYLTTFAGIEDFKNDELRNTALIVAIAMNTSVIIIQYLHYKQYFYIARLLYIGSLMSLLFILCNYVYPGAFLEYYFLFVPAISLSFIDSKKINYFVFLVSYIIFSFPNYYFEHYPIKVFNTLNMSWFFFGIFFLVYYFKTLNQRNEQALENKTKELENLNTFQSRFFINISHEIRTPITLIKSQVDQLKMFSDTFPEAITIEENLNIQIRKITKMVDDVIDLAKMESADFKLHLKAVNLSLLVHKLYLSFEPLFKQRRIHFELIKSNKNYIVEADMIYLERALNNIVVNALKYTDKGGKVHLELIRNKQEIAMIIKDTGIGISKEDIDKICNRFYQADNTINKAGGSGVGLAFSKEIINLHHGNLQIRSQLNKGSSFKIVLPLMESLASHSSFQKPEKKWLSKPVSTTMTTKDHLILIVEDNIEMRLYLKEILQGNKCLEAENGLEALDVIKNHKPNLIITDYMMPKMDGLQLIAKLKAQQYQQPIIMLTARSDKESKLDVLRLGVDDYLTKPFEKEELLIRIQNALKNHKSRLAYIEKEKLSPQEVEQNSLWIQQVKEYIEQQSTDSNLKQSNIADYFNLSLSTLYRKIKGETGLSPNAFIKEIKLQKARRLAENNSTLLLKQLSMEVGYHNSHYFANIYKDRFGHRPLSSNIYRKTD